MDRKNKHPHEINDDFNYIGTGNTGELLLSSFFIGLFLSEILTSLGVMNGQEAVDYYAEVHLSKWNSFVHTVGMPFTYMGFNIAVPALFRLSSPSAILMQKCFYIVYIVHYFSINPLVALVTALVYVPVISYGGWYNREWTKKYGYCSTVARGVLVSFVALSCQEYFGHYLGGDEASRPEGVLNAILYANYYSIEHIVA